MQDWKNSKYSRDVLAYMSFVREGDSLKQSEQDSLALPSLLSSFRIGEDRIG